MAIASPVISRQNVAPNRSALRFDRSRDPDILCWPLIPRATHLVAALPETVAMPPRSLNKRSGCSQVTPGLGCRNHHLPQHTRPRCEFDPDGRHCAFRQQLLLLPWRIAIQANRREKPFDAPKRKLNASHFSHGGFIAAATSLQPPHKCGVATLARSIPHHNVSAIVTAMRSRAYLGIERYLCVHSRPIWNALAP